MKKRLGLMGLAAAAALAVAALALVRPGSGGSGAQAGEAGVYTAGLGDVAVTVTCSGRLETENVQEITLPEGVKVEAVCVRQGNAVQAGDTLAVLDAASLQYRAAALSGELAALDQQLSVRRTTATIKLPVKGRVKHLPAAEGESVLETVNRCGALAILSTDGLMQLALTTDVTLGLNAAVQVKWNGGSAESAVAERMAGGYLITLSDEKAPCLGSAEVFSDGTLVGSGMLEIHAPVAVLGSGGVIGTVHCAADSRVEAGSVLFTLASAPVTDAYRQTMIERSDKAEQLRDVLMYLNSPCVTAEAAGTVHAVGVAEGAEAAAGTAAFTLGVGGTVRMTVHVDEVDIGSVALGQQAEITLDAFPAETFLATVTRMARVGDVSGSITTYAAELRLAPDARLLEGMNGSAVIHTGGVTGVVIVPLGAVHEDEAGAYVEKPGADGTAEKAYIETGLADGARVEVTAGLAAGEQIVYGGGQ